MFAYLKDRHGAVLTVDAEPLAADVLRALADQGVAVSPCRLAVNDEFVTPDRALREGDELALIPPVSGG